ncbi:hypothetical protein ONS95_014346 [Cadophora gregata]|uniref:uncharacterized protein n=1 Tax=Cadophora gregata TaxID=51156 RepID=UPI0026DD4B9F|nr:uncharacterized protein ONS95_014346 [Cadophora gregata]KAK0112603.1 hypothetical protein ONS95_014346 [Cadophora gregata]
MAEEKKLIKHIICCAKEEDVAPAKKFAEEQGGVIDTSYKSKNMFFVDMPADLVTTLSDCPHIESAELDQEVRICSQ